jgi:4-amino-4-deoxy-L-arabinose transferase-like glycosyltransferase
VRAAARILGILVCLFLGLFAFDAFSPDKPLVQAVPDFLIHLAPVTALAAVVALSWRREWLGGIVFTLLAVAYAYGAREHPAWIAAISGPLLVVGVAFLWSWTRHRRQRTA